jgi:hypothetical protein
MPAIVGVNFFVGPGKKGSRELTFQKNGREYTIVLRNFVPALVDAQAEREKYDLLGGETFFKATGVAFGSAWDIWLALNEILVDSTLFFWSQERVDSTSDDDVVRVAAERADDFRASIKTSVGALRSGGNPGCFGLDLGVLLGALSDTGIGGGRRSSLIYATRTILEKAGELDAARDCHKLIDYLTFRRITSDVRFIEQPFLFYPPGEDLILWDYLRHGGLMKAITRSLISGTGGKLGEQAGQHFEDYVTRRLLTLKSIGDVKKKVEIGPKKSRDWEIDLGFVISNVLILVEAKREIKPLRYHLADATDVSDRVTEFEGRLVKLDKKLVLFKDQVRAIWATDQPVGAICMICTEEVEFLASFDQWLWLDEGRRFPRILTALELVESLREGAEKLKDHPAFVAFS